MAGLLTTGAARCVDIAPVMTQVAATLPAGSWRARTWLERSSAIGPALRGRPAQLQSYADGLLHRGEDVEASIYVGLAAYIPALMGRLAECDSRLAQLRRLTRRHDTAFSVDTVGNGYAAAIVAEVVRGDLGSACDRARRPVPVDPAFSITSAAALAHAALLSSDAETMERAQDWATRGTFPLLQFLTPFTSCCRAQLDGALDEAADHAEDLWDQATVVPVWRLFALPLIAATLIGAGRVDAAGAITAHASVLLDDMETAPLLTLSLQLAQGQVALARGDVDSAESSRARVALESRTGARVRAGRGRRRRTPRRGVPRCPAKLRCPGHSPREREPSVTDWAIASWSPAHPPARLPRERWPRADQGILTSTIRSTDPSTNRSSAPACAIMPW